MTLQLSSVTTAVEKGRRPRWLGLACTTVLTVAVVAGLGVWQLRDQESARSSEQVSPPAVTSGSVSRPAIREESGPSYLYLVDSEEQAAWVRRFSAEVNALRVQAGQQPAIVSVLVTDAGAAAFAGK